MSLLMLIESLMAIGMSTFNIALMQIEGNTLVEECFPILMLLQALSAVFCTGVYFLSRRFEFVRLYYVIILSGVVGVFNSEIQLRAFENVNEIEGLNMFCILLTSMILLSYDQLVVAVLIFSGNLYVYIRMAI
jgi:hypothetical protein